MIYLGACGGGGSESIVEEEVAIIEDEVVSENFNFEVVLHSENNLMAIATVTTDADVQVSIEYGSSMTMERQTSFSEMGTTHSFTLVGMRANTSYDFKAIMLDTANVSTESDTESIVTGALPSDAPSIELLTNTQESEGGITFFAATEGASTFYGVDEAGEYVWYLHGSNIPMSASPVVKTLGDGKLMLLLSRAVWIINMTGELLTTYELPAYHHDVNLLNNGNLLMLTTEIGTFSGEVLKGDKIIEIDSLGNIVWEWSAFDHMDTSRFPGVLANRESDGQKDWTHSNALFYQSHDDNILLSSRSQSWVLNIDHATGEVVWIMGNNLGISDSFEGAFLELTSGSWMASQHAAMLTSIGDILIYDNRNEAELAGNIHNSRAVRFNINTSQMTAEQSWEYIAPKYTQALGDVDELAGGNILLNAGGGGSSTTAHLIEVTPLTPSQVVWEIEIPNTAIYRAERVSWNEFLSQSVNGESFENGEVLSNLIDIENCDEAVNFVDTNNVDNYIDYNLDGNTNADLFGDELNPTLGVHCDNDVLFVDSNGATNFDWINLAQTGSSPSTIEHNWTLPRNPEITGEQIALPLLGPIAITVTGLQVYGPNENSADNYANPVTDGLLNYCGGHTREYHFHERAKCFFEWETIGGAESLLPNETAGIVIGYALDGFPIMSPWECSDIECSTTVKVESSYRYIGNEDYANENAWDFHQYEQTLSPLDECNGMTRPDGSYAYYATDNWPYYLACYKGPTHLVGDNNQRFNP